MRFLLTTLIVLAVARGGDAQEPDVSSILKRFDAARPTASSLAFYSLDWAANLAEAKQRAAKERRPIFFIYITNITAGTDFFAGHC